MKEIKPLQAHKIVKNRKPRGKFYLKEDGKYVGIDNEEGHAWTEEFNKFVLWLLGAI